MQLRSRHLLALGGVGLALGATGVAVAGSGSGSGSQTARQDRLTHPGKLVREDRQAFLDDVAKRAGVDSAKLRDALGDLRGAAGPGMRFGGVVGGLGAAADYLGLTPRELFTQLRTKTLAAVASERSKSVDGLKQKLRDAARSALDQARSDGRITQPQEDAALQRLDGSLDDIVNGRNPQITALAQALGIDRQKLADAIRDAKLAQVDDALADKRIDQQEATRLKQRIRAGAEGLLGFGPLLGHGGPRGGRRGGDCDGMGRGARDGSDTLAPAQPQTRPTAVF